MAFLLDRDYKSIIRQEIRQVVIQNDKYTQTDAEEAAIEMIKGYLRGTYDIDVIFADIPAHDAAAQYSAGDYVYNPEEKIYTALVDDPGTDLGDTDDWKPEDPRNKMITRCCIDLALYDLHSHVSPGNIPELRVKRYDDAISWLNKVMKGQINPGLPVIEGEEGNLFMLGGNTKYSERW